MARMSITSDASGTRLDFLLDNKQRKIPATFWKGASSAKLPALTLLQHGGPFHRRHERTDELVRQVVERTGSAVLLIDGPIHGERRDDAPALEEMLAEFERHWRKNPGIEEMVSDWSATLDAVLAEGWADPDRVVWLGTSMGTAYGIPLCASEPRIRGCAIGMWGTEWGQEDVLAEYARRMRTPALFQIKSGDEIFSVEGQRRLFDAIGSADKCLHTFAGGHSLQGAGQLDQLMAFIMNAQRPDFSKVPHED